MAKGKKPTVKQQRFIDFYDGNATEAARKAGYKGNDKTLQMVGYQNLLKPIILEAIEKRQEKERSERNASREEKLELLTGFMRSDTAYKVTDKDGDEIIKPDITIAERIKAIETHCKMTGEFITKHELTGKDGGPVETANRNIEIDKDMDPIEAAKRYAQLVKGEK